MALLWLVVLAIAEVMSLFPDPSPCLVEIQSRGGANEGEYKYCAPFHIVAALAFEQIASFINKWHAAIASAATVIIAWFTWTLWKSTDKLRDAGERQIAIADQMAGSANDANKRVREIERANLTSGGGSGEKIFHLDVGNYGKTPAYLLEYTVIICSADKIGPTPEYLLPEHKRKQYPDRIPPGAHKKIDLVAVPTIEKPVVYGRVWYQDIWKETHYFSFILAILPTGGTHPDLSRALGLDSVPEAYTEWT
jgi:hypothetical protein